MATGIPATSPGRAGGRIPLSVCVVGGRGGGVHVRGVDEGNTTAYSLLSPRHMPAQLPTGSGSEAVRPRSSEKHLQASRGLQAGASGCFPVSARLWGGASPGTGTEGGPRLAPQPGALHTRPHRPRPFSPCWISFPVLCSPVCSQTFSAHQSERSVNISARSCHSSAQNLPTASVPTAARLNPTTLHLDALYRLAPLCPPSIHPSPLHLPHPCLCTGRISSLAVAPTHPACSCLRTLLIPPPAILLWSISGVTPLNVTSMELSLDI